MAGGRRGPAPRPTALKILEGNPGKRALNKQEPKPGKADLRLPAGLGHHGRTFWREIAPALDTLGVLTAVDVPALEAAARTYERWRVAESKLKDVKSLAQTGKSGFSAPSAYVQIASQAQRDLLRLLQEFGLTPASRTRIQVDATDAAEDPLVVWQKRMEDVRAKRAAMRGKK